MGYHNHILIEFKFVSLKQAGLSAEQARELTAEELAALPEVIKSLAEAKQQIKEYAQALNKRYSDLRLRKFAVVALGFERLCWAEG